MSLKISLTTSSLVRETIATGLLPELEFGLLKKYGDKLRWKTSDKSVLLDMQLDEVKAKGGPSDFEITIRTLCHSRGVTADYLKANERFQMKPCLLVLGDLGKSPSPWAQLVQPAVYLFQHEFNLIWVEIPAFITNSERWLSYGPDMIRACLKFLGVSSVSALAQGVGGSVFLQMLTMYPSLFSRTHFIYNLDLPEGSKVIPFPVAKVEELLRQKELQIWCAFQDDPNDGSPGKHTGYDHQTEGTAMKAYDAMAKMQSRLEGERLRGRRSCAYDEVLVTEELNNVKERRVLKPVPIGSNFLTAFSEDLLESLARFLRVAPIAKAEDIAESRGIVGDCEAKLQDPALAGTGDLPELPALRRLRIGTSQEQRRKEADKNRRRLRQLDHGLLCLMNVPGGSDGLLNNSNGGALLNSTGGLANTGNALSLDDSEMGDTLSRTQMTNFGDATKALMAKHGIGSRPDSSASYAFGSTGSSGAFGRSGGSGAMTRSGSEPMMKSQPSAEYTSMWQKIRSERMTGNLFNSENSSQF